MSKIDFHIVCIICIIRKKASSPRRIHNFLFFLIIIQKFLASQTSHTEILFPNDSNLSEEAKAANETIAAALNDFNESNIKPFINEGDEFQAIIPKLRSIYLIIYEQLIYNYNFKF